MEGVGTSVLVRIATRDDPRQLRRAERLIRERFSRESPAWVSCLVITDLARVLGARYRYSRSEIASFIDRLGQTDGFLLEEVGTVMEAVQFYRSSKADFGDCLILARNLARKVEVTHTFDRTAAKLDGFQLV